MQKSNSDREPGLNTEMEDPQHSGDRDITGAGATCLRRPVSTTIIVNRWNAAAALRQRVGILISIGEPLKFPKSRLRVGDWVRGGCQSGRVGSGHSWLRTSKAGLGQGGAGLRPVR